MKRDPSSAIGRGLSVIAAELPPNAWPEGTRTLRCLQCQGPFASWGRAHRICARCRDGWAHLDALVYRTAEVGGGRHGRGRGGT